MKVAASNLRFGDGVTMEVGMDLKNMNPRKVRRYIAASHRLYFEADQIAQVGVFTDPNVAKLAPMQMVSNRVTHSDLCSH